MFKNLLKSDFFQNISDTAKKNIIKTDRDKYKIVFDETRKLIQNDPIIILSNVNTIIEYITSKSDDSLEENMILYTTHPRRTTTMITNNIHKKLGKFILMKATIPNLEYDIIYNMRNLIKIYHIDRYKNIEIPKLFNAIKIDNLYYFPPEIELMDIYHKLYLPNCFDEWETLLNQEKVLYKYFTETEKKKIGGDSKQLKQSSCKKKRSLSINNIKLLILNFLDKGNYILIGEIAHKLMNSEDISNIVIPNNIQIITENSIENDYSAIVNYLSVYTNYGIYYKKIKLYTPKDNRIYKHTFYIKYPSLTSSIDKQFLDIYNCGEFELIPYIEKQINIAKNSNISIRIGNLFVQLRFLLIDLWLYKILFEHIKIIDIIEFNEKKIYIISVIKKLKKLSFNFKNKYMGINFDEKIEQKIISSQKNLKKNIYYPEISINKTKQYLLVATSS
jgi:hypothetical protein